MSGNKNSGRPKKEQRDKANVAITVWMRPSDKALVEGIAKASRMATGRWLGNVGIAVAKGER